MFDPRLATGRPEHSHEIKTTGAVRRAKALEIMPGGELNTMPLGSVDGVNQLCVFVGDTRLYLNKHDCIAVERHEVYFTEGA